MIINNISKLVIAVVLTLAVTFGSGVVAEKTGIMSTPSVQACGVGNGGGC